MYKSKAYFYSVFDHIYSLNSSLPCHKYQCIDGCEPGYNNVDICFLPYEKEYVESKIGTGIIFPMKEYSSGNYAGFVPSTSFCPAFSKEDRCSIYKYRPIDCRTYPLVPTKVSGQLAFWLHTTCKLDYFLSCLKEHVSLWVSIWKKLDFMLDSSWWSIYDRFPVPPKTQLIHVNDILDDFKYGILKTLLEKQVLSD